MVKVQHTHVIRKDEWMYDGCTCMMDEWKN